MGALVVGLTGGIGTGKSRVADLLRELGAAVECSDEIVREIQSPGRPALAEIAAAFGDAYLLPSGELDRPRLAALVFDNPAARETLDGFIHPRVYAVLRERLEAHRRAGVPVVVLDIPLLLEGGGTGQGSGTGLPLDLVLLVYADEDTQIERITARDGLSVEEARARLQAQMPIDEKRLLSDVVVDNSGAWEQTEKAIRELFASWSARLGAPG
jgi:dephospho-CoA kinase